MFPPVIVSIAVERRALRVLNPLGWNPLIASPPPILLHITSTDVHVRGLRFDLSSNLPRITLHQIEAAALKSSANRTVTFTAASALTPSPLQPQVRAGGAVMAHDPAGKSLHRRAGHRSIRLIHHQSINQPNLCWSRQRKWKPLIGRHRSASRDGIGIPQDLQPAAERLSCAIAGQGRAALLRSQVGFLLKRHPRQRPVRKDVM